MFNNHLSSNDFLKACLAAMLAIGLTACSSSSDSPATGDGDDMTMTPQQMCTADGGMWDADSESCTTAAQLAAMKLAEQRKDISDAIKAAETAVAGIDDESTDSEVSAAETAVAAARKAITDAADVPDAEKAANTGTVNAIANRLTGAKTSRTAAMDAADKAMAKANAKLGKDLRAALGPPAAADTTALSNIAAPQLSADGSELPVDAAAGAGALPDTGDGSDPASVTLEAGDSAGALGSWNGTNYAHTDTGTKVVNAAVVYTNKGPGKTVSFADRGNNLASANVGSAPGFTAIKGYLTVAEAGTLDSGAALAKIMADAFTHSGTQNHAVNGDTGIFTTRGTYDGAPGVYRCTGTCTSTNADGKGSPSGLGGTWHFKPDAGANAMAHQPDNTYLYYGWWLSKDKDGKPTAASAFTGVVGDGTAIQGGTTGLATNPNTLGGTATYAGHVAGKFAMSNPLDGTGSGGHFTADVELTAKFGATAAPNNGGVSGTIDGFMANGESVPWSVALHLAPWDDTNVGAFATPDDVAATTAVDESMGTTWSIDGNAAPRSGTWSGQMYDELPGNTDDATPGDGSDVPTTATGTFYSEFSTIGRMVGAFGADKQ